MYAEIGSFLSASVADQKASRLFHGQCRSLLFGIALMEQYSLGEPLKKICRKTEESATIPKTKDSYPCYFFLFKFLSCFILMNSLFYIITIFVSYKE